jgi:hypothetical protein
LIRLQVEHLPGDRNPKPVWLWTSATGATPTDVNRWWQAFLRRFDLEHTFRLFKQTLGWTTPKIRTPAAGDHWTWLLIAAHTQLRLARPLVADLRRPRGTPRRTRPAHPVPGPPRVPEHPPDDPAPRPRTQTQPTRPRPPARLPQPPPRDQPRRRQDRQTRPNRH